MTRQTKTPRQRDAAAWAASWAIAAWVGHPIDQDAANRAATELEQAERLLEHAHDHPDLRDTETGAGE